MTTAARVLIVGAAALAAVAPVPASVIERYYSQQFYAVLQPVITSVSSLVPFALLDASVLVLVVGAVALAARRWRGRTAGAAARGALVAMMMGGAVLYLWFLAFWGLNYRRIPLEQKLVYDAARVARAEGLARARLAVEQANALRAVAEPFAAADDDDLARALAVVEQQLGATGSTRVAAPKYSALGWYFRTAAIDGMTDPFFLEIILNPDLLPFERPFVLAHEWAHLAGYADESEANFVAWLVCLRGGPAARYSGWLAAYELLAASLPRDDRRELSGMLDPPVVADLAAARARLTRAVPVVRTASRGAYDTYLKANRIDEGIASYNAAVRLMLGTTFDAGWSPARRP